MPLGGKCPECRRELQHQPSVEDEGRKRPEEESAVQMKSVGGADVQRKPCKHCDEARRIQAKEDDGQTPAVTSKVESQIEGLRGGGEPLPKPTREFFEGRFGRDFGDVRVHTGGQAASSARSLGARAYTVGSDVVFGSGEYAEGTLGGRRLLAHELTHVVQQSEQRPPHIQRVDGETSTPAPASSGPASSGMPPASGLSVSMTRLSFLPAGGATFRPGSKARQGLEIALYRLIGGQYNEALAEELYQRLVAAGWSGYGTLSGDAAGGEQIELFGIPVRDALQLIGWLEQAKQLQVNLAESQRDLLRLGMASGSAWHDIHLPEVAREIGIELPPWYDESLFTQQMSSHIALLRRYIDGVAAYRAERTDANRQIIIGVLTEIVDELEFTSAVLEIIRADEALIGHEVYQLLWPSPRPEGAPPDAAPTPVMAPANMAPDTNIASSFFAFMHSQQNLIGDSYTQSGARQELLDRFGRFLGRGLGIASAGDQQISDQPGTANATPFPATLAVSPPLSGPPNQPQFEASAEADYRFIMSIQFPDVFSAFTNYYFEWNYVRVPDDLIGRPVEFDELNPEEPSDLDVAGRRFSRAGRYAVEDVETVFSELGPAGVAAMSLVSANAILRFVGTGIRLGIELLTRPSSERSIAFPGPGVYMVRNRAIPYTGENAELVRPPSVAFQPVIVRDPEELVQDRVRQAAAVNDREFARMEKLREALSEPVSHMGEAEMREQLNILERSLSSLGGTLEVQREQLVRYRDSLPESSRERAEAEHQIERLDEIISLRAARAESHDMIGAEPLVASFISDTGQSIRLTMEAVNEGGHDGEQTYWVSDLTTPKSSQNTGSGSSRAEAIMNAVEAILRGEGGYGRGHVAVSIDGITHSRRITASIGALFIEALENVTLALSVAAIAAAPFTGGATLVLLLPIGAIGAIPSAYRIINRAIDDTLHFDMALVMDIVNIFGGVAGLGHAVTPMRMVNVGRAFMVAGLGADGLGVLLIPVGVVAQIMELPEGLSAGERSARIMEILGQAMLNVGIMAGGALAQRARQQHMETHGRVNAPEPPRHTGVPEAETPGGPVSTPDAPVSRPDAPTPHQPETGTPGQRPAPEPAQAGGHGGNADAPSLFEATSRDGLTTFKLTEQGHLVVCSSPCTFFEYVYPRELEVNSDLRLEHNNIVRLLEQQMRRAPQNRDQNLMRSLFERGLRLQERLQNAQRVYATTVEPSRTTFPGHVDTLNNIQATLSHIDPGDAHLSQSRVHHAEVINDIARIESQGQIAGFDQWLTRASSPAERVATTHGRDQSPAEIQGTREAAHDVHRLIGELYEARRLAEQYAGDPEVTIRIGQDGVVRDPETGAARRSFDISVERRGSGGETTVERRVEVQYAGPVRGPSDLHTGIVHGAHKIDAEVAAGRAPLPPEALESTVQIEWPPAGRVGNIEYQRNGEYRVYDETNPTLVRRESSLITDLIYGRTGLNSSGFDRRVQRLSRINIIDQNGTLIWRLLNSAPGRRTWVVDYIIPAEIP